MTNIRLFQQMILEKNNQWEINYKNIYIYKLKSKTLKK